MKGFIAGVSVGAAASATGVAGYLGFQQLILVDQTKTVGQFQPKEPEFTETVPRSTVRSVAVTKAISQPERIETTKPVRMETTKRIPFEALSYCGQMDAIAKSGKSVSAFIAASADRNGYLWAAKNKCRWHRSQAAQISQPETSQIPFQALSYCDQLDALDRSGKSVAQFILNATDFNGYIWAAKSKCNWHSEQANVANLILNPPVPRRAAIAPVRAVQEIFYPAQQPSNAAMSGIA